MSEHTVGSSMVFGDHEIVHHPLSLIRERSPVTGRGGVFLGGDAPDSDWGLGGVHWILTGVRGVHRILTRV